MLPGQVRARRENLVWVSYNSRTSCLTVFSECFPLVLFASMPPGGEIARGILEGISRRRIRLKIGHIHTADRNFFVHAGAGASVQDPVPSRLARHQENLCCMSLIELAIGEGRILLNSSRNAMGRCGCFCTRSPPIRVSWARRCCPRPAAVTYARSPSSGYVPWLMEGRVTIIIITIIVIVIILTRSPLILESSA
jgi:hypothetical protein